MTALTEYTIERIYKKNRHRTAPHPLDGLITSQGLEASDALSGHLLEVEKRIQSLDINHPLAYLDRLREFFLLTLLVGSEEKWPASLQQLLNATIAIEKWDTYQLAAALKAAVGPKKLITPTLNKAGAAPFQVPSYWPAGELPHHSTHPELALVWYYVGTVTHDQNLIDAAYRIAQWQLTFAVDHRHFPLNSLFTQETEGSSAHFLIWNYLLFRAFGKAGHQLSFLSAADQHANQLQDHLISLYPLAIEQWIESAINKIHQGESSLTSTVEIDGESGVIIRRESNRTILTTLAGSKSGLGAIITDGVQIVNFGPQHLPFGDCEAFGLEQSASTHFKRNIVIEPESFKCHAKLRLASKAKPSSNTFLYRREEMSGFWIDYSMEYTPETLALEAAFIGFHSIEGLAFAFYVKAQSCKVGMEKVIALRSLEHFHGKVQSLTFEGHGTIVTIHPDYEGGEMEIIPLAGGESFWDADYLVGYRGHAALPSLKWRLEIKS